MQIRRCMKCMHELRAEETVCPHCGQEYGASQSEFFALKPGTILDGKYLVGEMLGQGGFGITYVGFDLLLEQKVAIKEYFPMSTGLVSRDNQSTVVWSSAMMQKTGTERGFESFLKEARKMAKLGSIPGVVGVKTVFIQNETAYIVMDYVEGETLLSRLQREGPMNFSQCVRLLTPIMKSLEEVHQRGIIHRDISPDNIMMKNDGTLVLLDLGAAKDLEIKNSDGTTQHSSQLVAKHGFSPYEQYTEHGRIGSWTDVYAMCATIYYCCTRQVPPTAIERVMEDHLSCQPLLTEPEFQILRKGMTVKAQDRCQTMRDLLNALNGTTDDAEEKRRQAEAERLRMEEERRTAEEAHRQEEEQRRIEESNRRAEEERRRQQQEQQRQLEEERREAEQKAEQKTEEVTKITGNDRKNTVIKLLIAVCIAVAVIGGFVLINPTNSIIHLKHAWLDATCTAPQTCSVCGATGEAALGHHWDPATCTEPQICSVCATIGEAALGHHWITTDSEAYRICQNCNQKLYAMRAAETYESLTAAGYNNKEKAPFWGQEKYTRSQVESVRFHNTMRNVPDSAWDVSMANNKTVMAWMDGSALHVAANGKISCPDSNYLFYDFNNLKSIDWGDCFDTSNVTDMNSMFDGCSSLTSLNLSSFDTSNVTAMYSMFYGCSSLTSLNLSSFDTSNVTDMGFMFYRCSSLTSLNLSSFDTSNVTAMYSMFSGCSSLTSLNLSSFDTSNVTSMYSMFYGCSKLSKPICSDSKILEAYNNR